MLSMQSQAHLTAKNIVSTEHVVFLQRNNKYAIKMEDLPIFKGLGANLGFGKKIRVPRRVGKKIRVSAALYTRSRDWLLGP